MTQNDRNTIPRDTFRVSCTYREYRDLRGLGKSFRVFATTRGFRVDG